MRPCFRKPSLRGALALAVFFGLSYSASHFEAVLLDPVLAFVRNVLHLSLKAVYGPRPAVTVNLFTAITVERSLSITCLIFAMWAAGGLIADGSILIGGDRFTYLLRGYEGPELIELQNYLSGEKNVTDRMAPVFLFESKDDAVISAANSELFVDALKIHGVPTDAHLFAHGKHGVGLATDEPEERVWPDLFGQWLAQQRFLPRQ